MEDGAFAALVLFNSLTHLSLHFYADLTDVLAVIGQSLFSLSVRTSDVLMVGLVESCPNLQYLSLQVGMEQGLGTLTKRGEYEVMIKKGLLKLKSLRIDYGVVRLGTDWTGYFKC
jgi:hypothetical protein